ncbi:MAG: aconitate hydratase AcnA [Thiotrichales bacterium]|nr:MAG: aconitate hydratase AcnA [Thiotrichales bacterium]
MSVDLRQQTKINIKVDSEKLTVFSLKKLSDITGKSIQRLPYSIRVLLENMLQNLDDKKVTKEDVMNVLNWKSSDKQRAEIPYIPARVVMQDFTGVPAVVDFAAMRDAFKKAGGDESKINPSVDVTLVIDHSVQVDYFGNKASLAKNIDLEFKRNEERYKFLKWGQKAFSNFKVVPPGVGIIHQVNLECLSPVVVIKETEDGKVASPDTLVGTDSHTTMINGLGVMGWGVGGIEAEAVMLGQPYYMLLPDVVGVELVGKLREGVTATDLVLRVTELLRKTNVVGKFVEYFGSGLENLALPDRATLANMAPEYGATMGFFPVDDETVKYLQQSNRGNKVSLVKTILKEQLLYRDNEIVPEYSKVVKLDLATVDSTLAGPKRPQDRIPFRDLKTQFKESLLAATKDGGFDISEKSVDKQITINSMKSSIGHGTVVIAAITSCTNTSNPRVMLGAGIIARNAVERGLTVKPYVKTSLAPGSQVVTDYLKKAGLLEHLETLNFNVVGYGCTTCIGNSGSLSVPVISAIKEGDLVAASVLSGNRNFEGRINPHIRANYLASPIHVVAYALVGRVDFDFENDSLGDDQQGDPVYLKDIWPSDKEINDMASSLITEEMFRDRYEDVFVGEKSWQKLEVGKRALYEWQSGSTYIQCPPFFNNFDKPLKITDLIDGRVLVFLGDSVTTDHISPAGAIPSDYPAGKYLTAHGVEIKDFNSYGARRGNHEVMVRGTFANVRLRNLLVPNVEGGMTVYHPEHKRMYIYDAAVQYEKTKTPLIIIAGKEYGTGSSRDWAAKGTRLLGVRVVIAQSYERIHRNNLVGMGVLPLQFLQGETSNSLGLDGTEVFTIRYNGDIEARQELEIEVRTTAGRIKKFNVLVRLDTDVEVAYYKNGGILQTVLKNLL